MFEKLSEYIDKELDDVTCKDIEKHAQDCIPWQNKHDVEPLLINTEFEYIQKDEIPGIRIYRKEERQEPFDIYFCKTKYNAYKIVMGLDREEVEHRMAERSKRDLAFMQKNVKNPPINTAGFE